MHIQLARSKKYLFLKGMIHFSVWFTFLMLTIQYMQQWLPENGMYFNNSRIVFYSVIYVLLLTICPYYNYFVLIPRYFIQKKYGQYALFLLLSYLAGSYLIAFTDKIFLQPYEPDWVLSGEHLFSRWPYLLVFTLLSNWVRLSEEYNREKQQAAVLQQERTSAELKWLKAQINPHFLFNALNNIHSLVHFKSDEASPMLVKLSDLMRYLFFEGNAVKVPLSSEMAYLKNYIELQLLKKVFRNKVFFDVHLPAAEVYIEPMLLINFVENAFKHGNLEQEGGYIRMKLTADAESLFFCCSNTYKPRQAINHTPGIGLENIRQRLNILYPEKHRIEIKDDGNVYFLELLINYIQHGNE